MESSNGDSHSDPGPAPAGDVDPRDHSEGHEAWNCLACGCTNGNWQRECAACGQPLDPQAPIPLAAPVSHADRLGIGDIYYVMFIAAGYFWLARVNLNFLWQTDIYRYDAGAMVFHPAGGLYLLLTAYGPMLAALHVASHAGSSIRRRDRWLHYGTGVLMLLGISVLAYLAACMATTLVIFLIKAIWWDWAGPRRHWYEITKYSFIFLGWYWAMFGWQLWLLWPALLRRKPTGSRTPLTHREAIARLRTLYWQTLAAAFVFGSAACYFWTWIIPL